MINKALYPDKLLVDGSVSMLKILPGKQKVRVREYPTGRTMWTWNMGGGFKLNVAGTVDGDNFVPDSAHIALSIKQNYQRGRGYSAGCMELIQ